MKRLLSYALPTFVQSVMRSGHHLKSGPMSRPWSGTPSWMEP